MRCHFSHTMVCPIWSHLLDLYYITDTESYLVVAVRKGSTNNNTPPFEISPKLRDSILNGAPQYRRVEWPLQAYSNSIGPMHLLQHNSRNPQNRLSVERPSLMIQAHHHGSLQESRSMHAIAFATLIFLPISTVAVSPYPLNPCSQLSLATHRQSSALNSSTTLHPKTPTKSTFPSPSGSSRSLPSL